MNSPEFTKCCLACRIEFNGDDEEECMSCEAERYGKEYDEAIQKETDKYNKRTGESREPIDFYCNAPDINKKALRGLKMITGYYDDYYSDQRLYESEYKRDPQYTLFEDDLPF